MRRFKHTPRARLDVSGILIEAIGELIHRRSRLPMKAETQLEAVGIIGLSQVQEVIEIAASELGVETADITRAIPNDAKIDTIGDLVATVQNVLAVICAPEQQVQL